jgi:hypothetical protein
MLRQGALGILCGIVLASGSAFGWSLLDEVTVIDPNLTAELAWELVDSKTYCESSPPNPDRLTCSPNAAEDFWIGVDAAGNRYAMVSVVEPLGSYFDIYRRPAGTQLNNHIVRITKNVQVVMGEPIKLFATGHWEVDVANGTLLINLRGDCFTMDCMNDGDTVEHVGMVRITGLPPLVEIIQSFEPPGAISFRVPLRPEGLPGGDRFDVYAGGLTSAADLSQAQPLACDVAVGRSPGQTVHVADPLPPPAPGEGRYYVTSVTHGSERRAGRSSQAGRLVGRDASPLQICN